MFAGKIPKAPLPQPQPSFPTSFFSEMSPSPIQAFLDRDLIPPLADQDEIRLLCLQPGVTGDKIVCTTQHVKLSTNPQYEALSYVWGSKDMRPITLNSYPWEVRENLFDALINLRHETKPRILWIDAICIKQDDVKERNHQVSRMGTIYSKASKVVAWLGLANEFTVEALGHLEKFEEEEAPKIICSSSLVFKNELAGTEAGHRILEGVRLISLRSYWTRLWIIQELQLASDADIQCGRNCVPWEVFKAFFMDLEPEEPYYPVFSALGEDEKHVSPLSNLIWEAWSRDDSPSVRNSQYLSHLCFSFRKSQCEKAIDKILGLWSLAPVCCQDGVPVDYDLGVDQVLGKIFGHEVGAHDTPSRYLDRDEGVDRLRKLIFESWSHWTELERTWRQVEEDMAAYDLLLTSLDELV